MKFPLLIASLGVCWVVGCQGDGAGFEPGGCGLEEYTWLPPEQVGQVLSVEEDDMQRYSASALEALLNLAGQNPFGTLTYGTRLFYVRYTTQDKGRSVEATGMIAVPWNDGDPAQTFPILLWHHGTTGFVGACAPSARSRAGASDAILLQAAAAKGYVVVGPDYIGLDADANPDLPPPVIHAYLSMEQVAIGSLDMLRAANALLTDELAEWAEPNDQVVLWGGSQGGHGVLASDRYAPLYAPEFTIQAAMALVPAADLVGLTEYALSSCNDASAAMAAALASQHLWYEGAQDLTGLFTDDPPLNFASELTPDLYDDCSLDTRFEGVTEVEQIFQPDAIDRVGAGAWDDFEPWACYVRTNTSILSDLPQQTRTPLLVVTGELDDLTHTPIAQRYVEQMCSQGHSIDYIECAQAGHSEAVFWSLPEQFDWLEDRLAGLEQDPSRVCTLGAPVACSAQPE